MNDENEKARRVLKALEAKGLTLGSVESFTGGLFGATVCSVPGASKVYRGSLVTYATALKSELAGVDPELIERRGVVSQDVANAMAQGGRKALGVDVCVSFTGNAGPAPEPPAKSEQPTGRVHISISTAYGHVSIKQDFPTLSRNEIRETCVDMALDQLIAIFEG